MGRLGLLGAGLLVGLGLDCAGAARVVDVVEMAEDELPDLEHATADPTRAASPPEERLSALPEEVPAGTRYVSLSPEACAAELASRSIAHEALAPRLGIASPVRLHGPLSGVSFRTLWPEPEPERARTSCEIIDCRLVLALDDFAKLLRAREIVEVMFFSA